MTLTHVWHRRALRPLGVTALLLMAAGGACSDNVEPLRSPVLNRRFGGDSIQPGAVTKVCPPDEVGCVPVGAVACPAPPGLEAVPGATTTSVQLSPEEQAWCAANAGGP